MNTLMTLLKANGAFSAVSGAVLLLGAPWLDSPLAVPGWLLGLVGAALIGYGFQVASLATPDRALAAGRFATAMDVGWVVGAAVVLAAFPDAIALPGRVALLLATIVVAGLAIGQANVLRRLAA